MLKPPLRIICEGIEIEPMLISSEPSVFTIILTISGVIRGLSIISTDLVAP